MYHQNKHKHTILHFSCSRPHPWVRGSSHCVVRVLWLTKYTLPLSWRFSADTKKTLKKDVSIIGQGSEGSPESVVLRKTKQKCHNHERKPTSLCGISLLLVLIPRWGQIFVCVTTVMWWNSHNMMVRYFSYKENTYFYKCVYSCVCSCVGSSPLVSWTVRWCPILLPPLLRHLFLINRSVRRAQKQ